MDLEEIAQRLYARTHRDGDCRLWDGSKSSSGYGTFSPGDGEPATSVHVIAWRLAHNWRRIPNRWVVRHKCNRPLCVEPTHLVVGTYSQNAYDCYHQKRRVAPRAQDLLTKAMIEEGRRLYAASRVNQAELARLWGVHPSAVSRALRGLTYAGGR